MRQSSVHLGFELATDAELGENALTRRSARWAEIGLREQKRQHRGVPSTRPNNLYIGEAFGFRFRSGKSNTTPECFKVAPTILIVII